MLRLILMSALFLYGFTQNSRALACASCGSGGDSPLVLAPNESLKIYSGFSFVWNLANSNPQGVFSTAGTPDSRFVHTLSAGALLGSDSFLTLTMPVTRNSADGESQWAWGDPLLGARHTLLAQSLENSLFPQVQILASWKPGWARSMHHAEHPAALDVGGSGFQEFTGGLDIWNGMTPVFWGASASATWSVPQTFRETEFAPGLKVHGIFTTGFPLGNMTKILGGLTRTSAAESSLNGRTTRDSDSLQHGWFFTGQHMTMGGTTFRLTFSEAGRLFANRNSAGSTTTTLAFMQSL